MQTWIVKRSVPVLTAICLLSWIAVFMFQDTQANDLTGVEDSAFQATIKVWLQDNDEDSLPLFADLADKGNTAARLLLSRIEVTDQGASDYLVSLSRKERIELFRSNSGKGLFRPTWLKTEMKVGNQFAKALLDSTQTVVDLDAIRKLYELGEPEAAYDLIREVAGNGSKEQKQELINFLPENAELLPYLYSLKDPKPGFTTGHAALHQILGVDELTGPEFDTRAAANFVEYGYQTGVQTSEFNQTNHYFDGIASWIEGTPMTSPIATLCRRHCGENTQSCVITTFGLVGGYYKAIKFDSPMQTLIDQSRFVTSNRAVGMVMRRISFARPAGASEKFLISDGELREQSECLAEAVAEVRAQRN